VNTHFCLSVFVTVSMLCLGCPNERQTFEHKHSSRFHYRFIKVRNFQLTSSLSYETLAAIGFDALLGGR